MSMVPYTISTCVVSTPNSVLGLSEVGKSSDRQVVNMRSLPRIPSRQVMKPQNYTRFTLFARKKI